MTSYIIFDLLLQQSIFYFGVNTLPFGAKNIFNTLQLAVSVVHFYGICRASSRKRKEAGLLSSDFFFYFQINIHY